MRLLLVDGANVLMRYVHAMVPGNDLAEHPAVMEQVPSVMRAVETVIRECAELAGAEHAVVCLDSVESWRKQLYPDYKGNRATTTAIWNNRLAKYCADRGIMTQRAMGFEADDVIATFVNRLAKVGHTAAVFSSDSDLLILASMFCDVIQFGRKDEPRLVKRTMTWVKERYGIPTVLALRGFKALVGEPSDNIPGLDGIGKVKAAKLLTQHGSIEQVMKSGALSPAQLETLGLMLQLVTLEENISRELLPPLLPSQCKLVHKPHTSNF